MVEKIRSVSRSSRRCSSNSKGSRGRRKKLNSNVSLYLNIVRRLKSTGLVNAYENFLRSLCVDGLPEPSILYERAAQYVLQYEKKQKLKIEKKQHFESYSSEVFKKSRSTSPNEKEISLPKLKKEKKR